MSTDRTFVIWASSYTERSGGALVLHYLCHYLNMCGYRAVLWHSGKLPRGGNGWRRTSLYYLKGLNRIRKGIRRTSPTLNTPLASDKDVENGIVIYPEVVKDNPLRASRVVRWFLHKPGYHTSNLNYGKNELYVYYQSAFNEPPDRGVATSEFYFPVVLECFKQTNCGERSGTCYILRKGRNRAIHHDINSGTVIDNLPHNEIAALFNRSEYCISYDMYTFYSTYAALCGCKSIVVPQPGMSKETWLPEEHRRFGVAYGEEDLAWAISTRPKLLAHLQLEKQKTLATVGKFADKCLRFFSENQSILQ